MTKWKAVGATVPTEVAVEGYYDDGGDWVPPQFTNTETPLECAFLPIRRKIMQSFPNMYTSDDREVFTRTKLTKGAKITYNGATYTVDTETDYSLYSGFFVYLVKAVNTDATT